MYIFSEMGQSIVNLDNVSRISVEFSYCRDEGYGIVADGYEIGWYEKEEDAASELRWIFDMLELGAKSYRIT